MKKTIIMLCAVTVLAVCTSVFAEAPELKQKLPTEWRHMERIEAGSLKADGETDALYKWLKDSCRNQYLKNDSAEGLLSCSVFYRESVGADEFYWQVACPETKYPFPNLPAAVIGLYYKKGNHLVFFGGCLSDFCIRVIATCTEDLGLQYRADTFQIIKGRKGAKGVVFYEHFTGLNDDMTFKAIMKGAVYGGCEARYCLLDTCITSDFKASYENAIRIRFSDFLWDEKNPLHYSLQNAFDGNPATSYVENTEDDLMKIEFQHIEEYNVTGLAIINGYAASEKLYLNNNRVADFQYNSNGKEDFIQKITLEDRKMGYQIFSDCFPNHPFAIVSGVKKIYNGDKYSDTCIAEINLLCKSNSYLFGDLYGN
ncbi:NADase-type glycan-binding domain-containing protein [Treponema sp.]|uniref:NADase-type glycan-binding domain-containing protein n=1 Tax=Treponema sp. TaxID=166 RepID=UPI003F11F0B1